MLPDDRLDSEIQHHLDLLAAEYERGGMSPDEARLAARRAFGGVEPMKESYRDGLRMLWVDDLVRDLRYAARGLRRNPGFAAVALATLALGIGANTALFSVLNALMLRTLPVNRPEDLVIVSRLQGAAEPDTSFSYPFYEQLRDGTPEFAGLAATTGATLRQMTRRIGDSTSSPEPVTGESVTHEYFSTLGVSAFRGRLLAPGDDVAEAPPVVVLSHAFWMRRFGGDEGVIGRTIVLDDAPFTIVGVAAPGFEGVEVGRPASLWWPVHQFGSGPGAAAFLSEPNTEMLTLLGRLRPGVNPAVVEARIEPIHQADIRERYRRRTSRGFAFTPDQKQEFFSARLALAPGAAGKSDLRYRYTRPLAILLGLVGIVLLVACANVANLMLARASARQTEFSVRLAIGAGRRRLVRQLLTESLLLAVAAGTMGVALAVWFSRVLVSFVPDPRVALDVGLDLRVLAFAAGTAIVTALLFGVAPAFAATRRPIAAALGASRGTGSRSRLRAPIEIERSS